MADRVSVWVTFLKIVNIFAVPFGAAEVISPELEVNMYKPEQLISGHRYARWKLCAGRQQFGLVSALSSVN